jgi:prepilin-type N-terminal cleavage/methylation domain-containing protein
MNTRITNQAGFSMVELLIAMLILGMVCTATFNFYTREHQQLMQQTDVSDTQQGLRSTME